MLDLEKNDLKTVDVDVDEDGLMWLIEEDEWKSVAEEVAISDIEDEFDEVLENN
jgi:hypothetical protein|tara:strand:+ start:296 stop:457 length:162 start_codon:yes stop_codon:yes gene_type:complete